MNIPSARLGNIPEINEEMDEEALQEIEQRVIEDMEKIRSLGATNEETKKQLLVPYEEILKEITFARWQREKVIAVDALKAHLKTVTVTCQTTKKRIKHALGAILRVGDVSLEVRRMNLQARNSEGERILQPDTGSMAKIVGIITIEDVLEASEEKWGELKEHYTHSNIPNNKTYSMVLLEIANMLTYVGVNKETVMAVLQRAALANIALNDWRGRREADPNDEEDDEIPDGLSERKLYGNEDPELDLGVELRIQKLLIREGIDTVQKALDMKSEDWEKIKGLGYLSRDTIAKALEELGVPRKMLGNIQG